MSPLRLVIIGPGRLGRSLAPRWQEVGHHVTLLGRDTALPPPPGSPAHQALASADAVVLTVPDRVIPAVAHALPIGPPILHTSGSQPLSALAPHPRRGALHPVMTFPGPERAQPDLRGVVAGIDATDDATQALARRLATDLGMRTVALPADRALWHAAAVVAGNFATVLLAEAVRVLAAAGVPRSDAPAVLLPLMHASLDNAAHDPVAALTGPVARGDLDVLDAHRVALRAHGLADLLPLYEAAVARATSLRAAAAGGEEAPTEGKE